MVFELACRCLDHQSEQLQRSEFGRFVSGGGHSSGHRQPRAKAHTPVARAKCIRTRKLLRTITVGYSPESATAGFDSPGTTQMDAARKVALLDEDPCVGDFSSAFQSATVKIEASYSTHNRSGAACSRNPSTSPMCASGQIRLLRRGVLPSWKSATAGLDYRVGRVGCDVKRVHVVGYERGMRRCGVLERERPKASSSTES
jgi:hypothetical protein